MQRGVWAPFNSQNTGYSLEYAPLMAVLPYVGRYDDIWASFIAQRIMWEHNRHVFYGPPFTWQERNEQSWQRNLEDETYGMRHTQRFCRDLEWAVLGNGSPVEMLARLWEQMQEWPYLPDELKAFGLAWCRDLEKVL